MDDNWDLHAVVRACCNATTTSTSSTTTNTTNNNIAFASNLDKSFSSFGTLGSFNKGVNINVNTIDNTHRLESFVNSPFVNLHEFYKNKPLACSPNPLSPLTSPISSSLTSLSASKEKSQVFQQQQNHLKRPYSDTTTSTTTTTTTAKDNTTASTNSGASRSKRRKNQLKRVCHVPADALSSDIWAWRKYGQKPIKGSPYPRGYYRCSSSKGCLARKQLERNKSDPSMFIVTYTSEHNHPAPTHRNSLAGSTRQKPQISTTTNTNCSSDQANSVDEELAPQSQITRKSESFEDVILQDDDPVLSNMALNDADDDFFEGLEDFSSPAAAGDCLTEKFPANFGVNWTATSATRGS